MSQGQLSRCEKLLNDGESEIVIHGLGAAVPRAVNLALHLKSKHLGTIEVAVNTSTVDIVGGYIPYTLVQIMVYLYVEPNITYILYMHNFQMIWSPSMIRENMKPTLDRIHRFIYAYFEQLCMAYRSETPS